MLAFTQVVAILIQCCLLAVCYDIVQIILGYFSPCLDASLNGIHCSVSARLWEAL